jgi:ribosome-binding protein aMBF1 (putative translation factor)
MCCDSEQHPSRKTEREHRIDVDPTYEGENVGLWIERQCEALGLSVAKVAREAQVDRATIHRWKTGRTAPYWRSFDRVRIVIDGYWNREKRVGGF